MKKNGLIVFAIGALLFLGACQTIPYPERVAKFEGDIKGKFVGKPLDELVLAYGAPQSSYDLSDGRKMVQYVTEKSGVSGGDTWMNYDTVYAGSRVVTRPDGSRVVVPIYRSVPVWETEPSYNYHLKCTKRFVVGADKIVQDFRWEGNSCF
jgi:hypothetical protein